MTKAYSYLRFSNPEQMRGDSLRRQTELAQSYADQHGLELDQELTFQDLGVSAFRGANVHEGQLGKFIEAVDSGKVPEGSYLLVENLDRLSRDKIMPALNRFNSLLEKGVVIVTLSDGRKYDASSLEDLTGLMIPLVNMARANEESEIKSRRLKAAWQNKRDRAVAEGHKLTKMAPAWLQLRDGEFKVVEERAAVVRRIFELALEGQGKDAIARRLNEEGVKPFGERANGWYPSYVRKILANEGVTGRFQTMRYFTDPATGKKKREPDGPVIEGYFPTIVDPDDFNRVKWGPAGVSGRKGKVLTNLLNGIVSCAQCGGAMHYISKGKPPKGAAYFACDNARRKRTCDAKSVRYEKVLQEVLDLVDLPTPWLLGQENHGEEQRVREELEAVAGAIADLERKNTNLVANLELAPSKALADQLARNEEEITSLHEATAQIEAHLQDLGQNGNHWAETKETVDEFNRVMASDDQERIGDIRVRLNACLKKLIERVELGPEGVKVIPRGALPEPGMGREVARDGSFMFVDI